MRFLRTLSILCGCVLSVSGCAATQAYLTKHPDAADEAAIAAAAIQCVDSAVAGVIVEDAAPVILAQALACAANVFSGAALEATKDAVAREVVSRQAKIIRTIRMQQLLRPPTAGPLSLELDPNPYSSAIAQHAVIEVPELKSWEDIIACNSAD